MKKVFLMAVAAILATTSVNAQNGYNDNDGQVKSEAESLVHVNWQVSLIGIEAGSPTVRGFAELGTGEQGIILAGVRYKF